jgi:hypothetical protein
MSGQQLFAAYLALSGVGLLGFALGATRSQLSFDRAARVVPAEFIGWRESVREGRGNRDFTYTALYRYRRDGRSELACGLSFRSRIPCDPADPLVQPWRWLLAPRLRGEVVRYVPDGSGSAQVGRARAVWASVLFLWAAGLALVLWAGLLVARS